MATDAVTTPARSDRSAYLLREAAPWVGIAAWLTGLGAIWFFGMRLGWGPGELVLAGCVWVLVGAAVAHNAVRGMFGPVFMYEVVRLGRKKLTIILRLLYVLGVMVMLGLMYFAWLDEVGYIDGRSDRVPSERLSNFATEFFVLFMAVQYCVVGFLTPAYVAGSIADEKERKTLEFLLATDLKNREIIFGKLAARVTVLLMFVLAGLPVVAFLQLFGGIDPDLLLAGTAATVITVLGLAAVSVFFSTTMKKPRDAIALTYLAALVYLVGSGFLAGYVRIGLLMIPARGGVGLGTTDFGGGVVIDWTKVVENVAEVTDWVAAGNVVYQIIWSSAPGGGGSSPAAIGTTLMRYSVFWGVAATYFLGYSVFRLRAISLRQAYGGVRTAKGGGVRRALTGGRAKDRPGIGDDPMFWKEVFVDSGARGGCAGRVMTLVIAVLIFLVPGVIVWQVYGDLIPGLGTLFGPNYHRQTTSERWQDFTEAMNGWARVATGILGAILMVAAAVRGSGAVSGERDRDTWVSLVSTPLSAWEMVRGKWLGTVLGLRRAYLALLLVWALALVCGAVDPPMILVTALYTAVYVSAFAWVGILCSITSRTTLIATVRAMMISVFIGGGFWFFLLICCIAPVKVVFRSPGTDLFDHVQNILLGWTPPLVLGWLPLNGYERRDLLWFSWEHGEGIGPLSPVLGFFVWFGLSWVLGLMSWQAFRRVSNRTQDVLDGHLPRAPVQAKHVSEDS